jgi:hypothetical protein
MISVAVTNVVRSMIVFHSGGKELADGSGHPYNDAGRRLKAALVSYQLGRSGVDYTLKQMPELVDESWAELAENLLREMANAVAKSLLPASSNGSDSIQ